MKNKKIGIIGYGNVGKTLEYNLSENFEIIIKRHKDDYKKLANCEVIIITVQDNNLEKVLKELKKKLNDPSKIIFHTSGSIGLEAFHNLFTNFGCFHFPMSIRKEHMVSLKNKYVLFQGNKYARKVFTEIFNGFDLKVFSISPEKQELYHYICSLLSNIPFYFLYLGMSHLDELNIPKEIGVQLMESAFSNFKSSRLLSGPLMRKDIITINKHLDSIEDKDEQLLYTKVMDFFNKIFNESKD